MEERSGFGVWRVRHTIMHYIHRFLICISKLALNLNKRASLFSVSILNQLLRPPWSKFELLFLCLNLDPKPNGICSFANDMTFNRFE